MADVVNARAGTPNTDKPTPGDAGTHRIATEERGLREALRATLELHASHPAISFPHDGYHATGEALLARASSWRDTLQGLEGGIPILHLDKSVALYEIVLACLLDGSAYCPLDVSLPPARVMEVARQFRRAAIITRHPDLFPVEYTRILLDPAQQLFALLLPPVESSLPHRNAAYHIATSGSTGLPKIVVVPQDHILPYCSWLAEYEQLTPAMRWAQFSGTGFDLFLEDFVTSLLGGAELVVLHRPADRTSPGRFIEHHRITHWNSVPSVIPQLLRDSPDLTSVKTFHFVGEPLLRQLAKRLHDHTPHSRIINKYCPTESALYCCQHVVRSDDLDEAAPASLPVGTSVPGAAFVFLEDGDDLRSIIISNKISAGYHGQEASTFGVLTSGEFRTSFFDTGDFFRLHEGKLYFSHRRDGMVKIRGNRVDKGDLANAAIACGLVDAVVAHVEGKLFLVHEEGTLTTDEREFFAQLRQRLPPYSLPSKIFKVPMFPRTHSGKINHRKLEEFIRHALASELPNE
jgi:non-ribosomal peptide synthetase component F